jgi:hypothetical protein
MISEERLEELIEQKKSIYWKFAKIKPSSWSKYTIMGNTIVKGNLKEIYSLDDLFETKEDFEWHRQFGCIERTERLELPTWEELQNKREFYLGFNNKEGIVRYYLAIDMPYQKDYGAILISYSDANNYTIICFDKIATKENYTLACRKCKELFLGEKDE